MKKTNNEEGQSKPNSWKAGRPPTKKSKVNRSDNESGKILVKADPGFALAERDDPAYIKFSEIVGGKEGLKELAAWSENTKAQKLFQILDDDRYKTYGIKALAKRCGMTLPELCNLFREKHFLETFITFFQGVPEIAKGAVQDASPSQDVCPNCGGFGTLKHDGYQVKCPKCGGSGKIRVSGDKEARRDVFKAVGLIKDAPSIINQQNITVEGVDNFEDLMKSAKRTAIDINEKEVQDAEIVE